MSKTKKDRNAQTLTVIEQEQQLVNRAENALQTMGGGKKKEKVSTVLFKRGAITFAGIVTLVGCGSAITGNNVPTVDTPQVAFSGEMSETNADGTYTGYFKDGHYDGFGTYEFLTGETYSGNWENDQYSGAGKMVYPDIGTYDGNYADGLRNGEGTFTWADGTTYSGNWANDKLNGEGTLTYADGSSISGTFVDNTLSDYTLEISNDDMTGTINSVSGIVTANVSCDNIQYSITVSEDGNLTGSGTISYPNGDAYSGDCTNGQKSYGTYTFANGDTFSGTYSNDSAGNGTYKFVSGNTLSVNFSDMSNCQLTYTVDGKEYLTQWTNGRCTDISKK